MNRTIAHCLAAAIALPSICAAAAPAPDEFNLVSFANGAWILKKPAEYDSGWSSLRLLDERNDSGWTAPKGQVGPHEMLIVLPEQSVIKELEFDSARADGDAAGSRSAKDIVVEVSNAGPASGFEVIAKVSLKPKADKQRFAVSKAIAGRWIRLTIKNNHGSAEYVELMDFRAYGEQKTKTAVPNLSGTYATNYSNFHLRQDGAAVTGCYEYREGLLVNGGVEGRVTRFTWVQGKQRGPAMLTFSPDGKEMLGLWWNDGQTNVPGQLWSGKKTSDAVGTCPHWPPAAASTSQLANDLVQAGRARLYGINFDTDSDQIKPESKAALDDVIKLAKDKPDWNFTIEGHTDSTATAAHNQTLSEQRALAVKARLVAGGVPPAHLTTKGLGASQPLADNNSTIGRAQNRRVELVKN
jgi:OmpA-OmpF porin, OOP family